MLILDTHAVVWWTLLPKRLSRRATRAIDAAEQLGVPAIVLWEVAMLTRRRRLEMDVPVAAWVDDLLRIPRVHAIPLTASAAVAADTLDMDPDPADRFIVATTRERGATLLTKDRRLRQLKMIHTVW